MVAVALYGYPRLGNAVGGAVLGAFAGLGFATVENFLYLSGVLPFSYTELTSTAMARAGVSVGHVLWSATAGYYLGLAKAVPEHHGALILKGFLVAVLLHATYNSITVAFFGVGTGAVTSNTWISAVELGESAHVVFILIFYAGIGYYVLKKIERHRSAVRSLPGFG
ncbi:MAG: PrsW family glutamic-type intramembrane protease [Halobacteriales archaeon]|nr:PrsW family glutamic-type intramembrane protease [Halobacteriales archaeon]